MTDEISGDTPLSFSQRALYIWRNLKRNLKVISPAPDYEHYQGLDIQSDTIASPSRVLTEHHLRNALISRFPLGEISVLEIGCGSGRLCELLSDLGYRGRYTGIDITDKFSVNNIPGFSIEFLLGDAHDCLPDQARFDLIISVSALEHIKNDLALINRLPLMLEPRGIELHYVPSGWGLLLYVWHGYRQYPLKYIGKIFGANDVKVDALGGGFSAALHFFLITLSELLLRFSARSHFQRLYKWLLNWALKLDKKCPVLPAIYAITRPNKVENL